MRKLVYSCQHLKPSFLSLQRALRRVARRRQVILVIGQVVTRVGRRSLPLAIIVDDQIPSQAHEPVRQISKGGVILAERTIHANEDLLRKVFSRAVTGGEPVSQVVDAPRV